MARTVTFLQLASEFGGTKFGPFEQVEVRLGSDPANSDITLPEALGVAPQHVKLLKQQDDSFILAPVDKSAAIWHFRQGTARPKQVLAPTAIQNGDAFALVTPEGPRFYVLVEKDPRAIAAQSADASGPGWAKGIKAPPSAARLGRGIAAEIRRRGFAAVFTTRLGNAVMKIWMMVKTGQIFSPVYIVGGMIMLSGWLFAGGGACSAFRMSSARNDAIVQLSNCRDQLGVAQDADGDLSDPTVPDLTKVVLLDSEWGRTLVGDKDLYESYARALRDIYAEPLRYRYVYTNKGSKYNQFKQALEGQGLPPNLVRTLAFAAASPTVDRTWSLVKDSESAEVCGRGPLALTYRQARNLGLASLQPDALVERQLAESNDLGKQREALDRTLREAGAEYEYRDDLIQSVGAEVQGGLMCLYVDGTDDREDLRQIATALRARIGATVTKNLPRENEQYWIAARLVMLFAHDFKLHELEQVSFDARMAPSVAMSTKDVKTERAKYAVREAAKIMARAAAIPCLALFDKEQREVPQWFMEQPPKLGSCAILKAYVEYDRL